MKTRNHTLLSLAAFAGLALAATSATAEVITPVSATASSEYNATNGAAGNLLGPGFTALDPIESSTHANGAWGTSAHWFSSAADKATPHIDFDLGGTFTVGAAHIWNYNGGGQSVDCGLTGGGSEGGQSGMALS